MSEPVIVIVIRAPGGAVVLPAELAEMFKRLPVRDADTCREPQFVRDAREEFDPPADVPIAREIRSERPPRLASSYG